MKHSQWLTAIFTIATLTLSGHTQAHAPGSGLVIRSVPVYETRIVREPVRHCTISPHSHTHTVIGGTIGAMIGLHHEQDPGAALLGGLIGAGIGQSIDRHTGSTRYCSTSYRSHRESVLTGYRVTYRYRGKTYTTVTSYKPGRRIELHKHHGY